jgi:hypothetical protein
MHNNTLSRAQPRNAAQWRRTPDRRRKCPTVVLSAVAAPPVTVGLLFDRGCTKLGSANIGRISNGRERY